MPDDARRGLLLVAACLALAALSLLLPWAIAFDPWAWLSWGRDVTRLELHTAGGPSWKPLPVVATAPLALTGDAAPALWLVLARAGGLLAVAGAALLAARLARAAGGACGRVAAAAAALAMALSSWWLFNTALGNSEGLLAATVLWAVIAHLDGRWRLALVLLVAAGLLRPEVWPFLGLYGLWLWRTQRVALPLLAGAAAVLAVLWFGPDVAGAGGALGASDAARGTPSALAASDAAFPAWQVLVDFAELVTLPVLVAAFAGALLGDRTARALALAALAWVALVALMTQAGYAGNPRYNVAPAAIACVLAGVGVAAGATRAAGAARVRVAGAALAAVLAAATLAFTAGELGDQVDELGARADRRTDLDALLAQAVTRCSPVRTNQPMKAMLAWQIDAPMEHLADPPGATGTIVAAPEGYDGGAPRPAATGAYRQRAAAGDWVLATTC